jgi:hypothetical protein
MAHQIAAKIENYQHKCENMLKIDFQTHTTDKLGFETVKKNKKPEILKISGLD